jgi:hypothetical protein
MVWQEGVPLLHALTGKTPAQCRSILGKLLRDMEDDCPRLMLLLQRAQESKHLDPLAWITAAAKPRDGPKLNGHGQHQPARNGGIQLLMDARTNAATTGSLLTDTLPDD